MKTRRFLMVLGFAASLSSVPSFAQAAAPGEQCQDLFMSLTDYHAEIKLQEERNARLIRGFISNPSKGLETYAQLVKLEPEFATLFPEREVTRIFATEEMPYFERNLEKLLTDLVQLGGKPTEHLARLLRSELQNKVPQAQIEERIATFMAGRSPIERVLGDNSMEETQILFHGGNPLAPTPESLLGQYLKETGASTVARTFNTVVANPAGGAYGQGEAPQGTKKLAVAVSAETFPIWQKYFNREDLLSVFGHAQVVQNGKIVSYSQAYGDLRAMSEGNILPALILKTTIAQRTEFYLNTIANRGGGGGWSQQVMVPWMIEGYMSIKSAYETCTQWIGNMPVGDQLVPYYSLPGAVDNYAQNQIVPGVTEQTKMLPRIAILAPHKGAQDVRLNKLFRSPGYAQLTTVIGQTGANTRGEWANPGWLITSLIGETSPDFVPFVFVFTNDVKAPLDPKFVPKYEEPR